MTVRTRIAPSPTGFLHLGTARTALFSWAVARKLGGQFVLRIEDTDVERNQQVAVDAIIDSLQWLGLTYDEGPIFQTQRLARYTEVLDAMLADGRAYRCYATQDELTALRESQREAGLKPRYDGRWRPENASGKTPPEGIKPVIRFRNPDAGDVIWQDLVKGEICISNTELDDLVLARQDGIPTYNFAVVVDDIDMRMTHVIRGDDHVNNTPRQINLYRALGATVPHFGHVPMILGPDGKKLSKRHGAVSVMQWQEDGFLPETMLNGLARLGWAHGDEEIFSAEQFIEWFDLGQVAGSPAQFDLAKFHFLNNHYLKQVENARLARLLPPFLARRGVQLNAASVPLEPVIALLKDRANTLADLAYASLMFYWPLGTPLPKNKPENEAEPPTRDALKVLHINDENRHAIIALREAFAALPAWTRESINAAIKAQVAASGLKMPKLAIPVRVLVAGMAQTPSIDAVLELFGQQRVVAAMADA